MGKTIPILSGDLLDGLRRQGLTRRFGSYFSLISITGWLPATHGQLFLQGIERLPPAGCSQFSLLGPSARISHSEIGFVQYLPQPIHVSFGQLDKRRYTSVLQQFGYLRTDPFEARQIIAT